MSPYNYDRCEHCGAEVTRCKPWNIPSLHDSYAWSRIAAEHEAGCDFAVTRDFRAHLERDDDGGRFNWLINNETGEPICKEPTRAQRGHVPQNKGDRMTIQEATDKAATICNETAELMFAVLKQRDELSELLQRMGDIAVEPQAEQRKRMVIEQCRAAIAELDKVVA